MVNGGGEAWKTCSGIFIYLSICIQQVILIHTKTKTRNRKSNKVNNNSKFQISFRKMLAYEPSSCFAFRLLRKEGGEVKIEEGVCVSKSMKNDTF